MKHYPSHSPFSSHRAFTFVEILAAMLFMAIVVPAIVHGLTVANRLGVLTDRKKAAIELADSILTEKAAVGDWSAGGQEGDTTIDSANYHWILQTQSWPAETSMMQVSVEVRFKVQEQDCTVNLSTLVDGEAAS